MYFKDVFVIEDETRLHRDDMSMIQMELSLVRAGPDQNPSIIIPKERKGTKRKSKQFPLTEEATA
jgi:hypothetical protein